MNLRKTFVDSPLGKDQLLLRRLQGREALAEPFVLDLELLSLKAVEPERLLGKTMSVQLELPGKDGKPSGKVRCFHGHVTELGKLGDEGRYQRYSVQLRPWLWLLELSSNCRIFQRKTVPEIVKDVAAKHGFADMELKLTGSYEPLEYCVQYRESDLAFVSRLLEREGIYYYFRHEATKHTLVLADGPTAHTPQPGAETIELAKVVREATIGDDRIDTWQTAQRIRSGSYALDDYDFEKPTAELKVRLNAPKAHDKAAYERYDYPGGYTSTSAGERYARVRLQAQQASFDTVRGSGTAHGLAVGSTFNLREHPVAAYNTSHLVVETTYQVTLDAYESSPRGTEPYRVEFVALKADVPFRPQRRTPQPVIAGLQTAKVVGPKAEEIWTDRFGRVKVQFPWDREGKFDEQSSCWIRVAQVWAGSGWGSQHIPRIGQEVVVSFLEGDPDRPLITGAVYNGNNAPPFPLPGKPEISGLKTDSTKNATGYNELSFDDTRSAEKITIHAQRDMQSTIENDCSTQAKNKVTLEAGKQLALQAGSDALLQATGDLTVDGKKVLLTATEQLSIQVGLAQITLNAAGMITISGNIVMVDSKAKGLLKGMILVPI
jgi:type VI secretion system secreted protein VgrG